MDTSLHDIHELRSEEVFVRLRSRSSGLTDEEAASRLREVGLNRLKTPSKFRWVTSLAEQFFNFFSILLDVAAAACFIADSLQPGEGMELLGWALLSVSILNALFAFAQEMRAERAMEELLKYLPQIVRVRRNGVEISLSAEHLVPGDLLILLEGDRIAADARLIQSEELLVNNAPLTGESRAVAMTETPKRGRLVDSRNIVFAGSSVLQGSGTCVVYATGDRTEFGRIAALSRDVRRPPSPIERETNRMIRILTVVAVIMGTGFFCYGVVTGRSLWTNIVFMLGIIVANVPEGLLPTFTLSLSVAGLRMAKKKVLVKSLESVEALGAVHVICTDKTGTLTKNELAIAAIVDPLIGKPIVDLCQMRSFLKVALIASELRENAFRATNSAASRWCDKVPARWHGDPLDVVIAEHYERKCDDPSSIIHETKRHFPFDLHKRREAGVFSDGQEALLAVKGAWESLRPLVGSVEIGGGTETKDANPELLAASDAVVHRMASLGQRVIAVAYRRLSALPDPKAREESLEQALVLKGFLSLEDPLREDVPAAVESCRRAGIRVVLITGDHAVTAEAIARRCGILAEKEPGERHVFIGAELEALSEQELAERLQNGATVFARSAPEQKMKIVTALKHLGNVVAMTGDGVNDAPALKAADVGIAMGMTGTDVAREAADVVLLDDNFASIVNGVEEGRTVFRNMQTFTAYVLASNIPEIVPFLLYVVFPVPLALTVIQILSIDLGTDLLPAIGLGQEPPKKDTMNRPPRRPNERLLSFSVMGLAYLFLGLIQAFWSMFMFFYVLRLGGWQWGEELSTSDPLYRSATGITLSTIILMQIANVVGRRSLRQSGLDRGLFRNDLILTGVAFEVLFSWAILYWEPLQRFLGTGSVAWQVYAISWLGIPLLFLADLARKRGIAAFEK